VALETTEAWVIGLDEKLTPAERLRWLETTMATMRGWVGRAREGRPLPPEED
jgi:hypothetical protein